MFTRLTCFVPLLLCSSLLAHKDDGCPQHFRRCNDQCLDRTTNHTTPCDEGPWGKCLSAQFPFYCASTNACIRKDELCGALCFSGSPDSFWYDHWTIGSWYKEEDWISKDNQWRLEEGAYDVMKKVSYSLKVPVWLERYNCNGKCTTYLESCNGVCNHPDGIDKGGVTMDFDNKVDLVKCGNECRKKDDMKGFHDCGEECLPQNKPCQGTCPNSTLWATGPQWKCGNECRPNDQRGVRWGAKWRECPDGTCREKTVGCDGSLPGTCPEEQVLCRYSSWIRGTDFECRDSSQYYVCKEDRAHNAWGNLFGKHDDDWCNRYEEACEGECRPGYLKCMVDNPGQCKNCIATCKDARGYIQCEDGCKEKNLYHNCDGTCISTEETCHGSCPVGFEMCGVKCIESGHQIVDCNGKCQTRSEMCNGECWGPDYFKLGDACEPSSKQNKMHECNGVWLEQDVPCNGKCKPNTWRDLCDGKCLKWNEKQDCNGQCKHREELCDGKCYFSDNVICGNRCIGRGDICQGECHHEDYPFKCKSHRFGETCLDARLIGDGNEDCVDGSDETTTCYQGWMCDGKLQCSNEPCHGVCPTHVNRTVKGWGSRTEVKTFAVHYCAEEDKCKLEGEPCNGVCVVGMKNAWGRTLEAKNQFACHDGSRCIDVEKVCNGREECTDGSDEVCKVRGCPNCKLEIVKRGNYGTDNFFLCESGDQKIKTYDFCDGKEDCRDGSDEKGCDICPGIVICNPFDSTYNDEFVCANIPCKERKRNDRLICSTKGSPFLWDMCEEPGKDPKCVKRSWKGGQFEMHKGKMVVGDQCNGQCLNNGVICGDKCLPPGMGIKWACNGDCSHIQSSRYSYSHVDGRCLTDISYYKKSGEVLTCDGEYRFFDNFPKGVRDAASRRTCNGVCLSGDEGKNPWIPCATGNECYPAKEWCDGFNNCQDGSDEANCAQCPELVRCEHGSHPLINQTASNGPGFPDYVCSNEPCGECADPGRYPCGNGCTPKDVKCPLTDRCGPDMFECGGQCLEPELVCDGKADCIGPVGMDELNCNNTYQGSWFCNGNIQSKTIPCV